MVLFALVQFVFGRVVANLLPGQPGHVAENGDGRTDVAGGDIRNGGLARLHAVDEVIGVKDELKGQRASGFVTLKAGVDRNHDEICTELVKLVRDKVGPVAAFRDVLVLERLPKTRSGKILRKTMRQIVDGEDFVVPPTIEDISVLEDLTVALVGNPEPMKPA